MIQRNSKSISTLFAGSQIGDMLGINNTTDKEENSPLGWIHTKKLCSLLKHSKWCRPHCLFVCLCWGLTSQSTIFQSCRDGATASWVINQYFRGVKCLAQGHNTAAVGIEPPTSRSEVRHSTTEPPRSPIDPIEVGPKDSLWRLWEIQCPKQGCNLPFQSNPYSPIPEIHISVKGMEKLLKSLPPPPPTKPATQQLTQTNPSP